MCISCVPGVPLIVTRVKSTEVDGRRCTRPVIMSETLEMAQELTVGLLGKWMCPLGRSEWNKTDCMCHLWGLRVEEHIPSPPLRTHTYTHQA